MTMRFGQNRIVYTVSNNVVMKLTTDLAAHGHDHEFSVMFKQMAAQVLGLTAKDDEFWASQGITDPLHSRPMARLRRAARIHLLPRAAVPSADPGQAI